jgi:hypothetical protein
MEKELNELHEHVEAQTKAAASAALVSGLAAVRQYGALSSARSSAGYNIPQGHTYWGGTTPLTPSGLGPIPGSGAQYTSLILSERYDEAVDWHMEIQAPVVPTGPGHGGTGVISVQVQYQLGQQLLPPKFFTISDSVPRQIHINSRFVNVSAAWWGVSGFAVDVPATLAVNFGCSVGGLVDYPASSTLPEWSPIASSNVAPGPLLMTSTNGWLAAVPTTMLSPFPVGGQLQAFQAIMQTMTGDGQAYVLFIDKPTTPTGGENPIWTSPPFTSANQWVQFDDGDMPRVCWSTNLWVALSSTPGSFLASSGSGSAWVPCKLGK